MHATLPRSAAVSSASPTTGEATRAAARQGVPPLSPKLQLIRAVLVLVCVLAVAMVLEAAVVSGVQQAADQGQLFNRYRAALANGVAPIGPTDSNNRPLALGTPIAHLDIPSLDVHEVIVEGTTSGTLFSGPGHRRDTPFPGQVGWSVVFGRRAAFGGPLGDISSLKPGDMLTVTTGQGEFSYKVIGVRPEGAPLPPAPAKNSSRLTLATAAGTAFMPSGVLRVDADLQGAAVGGAAPLLTSTSLPKRERELAGDSSTLWALALWLQFLILGSVGLVWAWNRWGKAQAWVVFFPLLLLLGLAASGEVFRLWPNLM